MLNKHGKRSWSWLLISVVILSLFLSFEIPNASAAITRIQGNARGYAGSGTSVTVTMASTPTIGNTIIATIYNYDFEISSFNQSGVSWDAAYSVYSGYVSIWKGFVTGAASKTITVTTSRAINTNAYHFGCVVDVCEYSGKLVLDKSATSAPGLRNPAVTGTTASTTENDEVWVGGIVGWVNGAAATQSSPGSGFTLLDGASYKPATVSGSMAFLEKIVTATGAASSTTNMLGTYWNAACMSCWKVDASISITFCYNTGGVFQVGGSSITNNTAYGLVNGLSYVLSGLPNTGYSWSYFSWANNASSSTNNPYTYTVSTADTVWCIFGSGSGSSGPNLPFEGAAAMAGVLLFFMLFVGLVVLVKRR